MATKDATKRTSTAHSRRTREEVGGLMPLALHFIYVGRALRGGERSRMARIVRENGLKER